MKNLFIKKKLYFYNLNKILIKMFPKKNKTTVILKKLFKLNSKLKVHDALNDCILINDSIKHIIKFIGKKRIF